jgi:hypothetical protein
MKMIFTKHYLLKNNAKDIATDSIATDNAPYQLVLLSVVCLCFVNP